MRRFIVNLDQTENAWPAAYTAFHIAARSGARLVGLSHVNPQTPGSAEKMLREFAVGARAAGVSVETRLLPEPGPENLLHAEQAVDAIFIGRSSLNNQRQFAKLADQLNCPLWVISSERSIRRLVAIQDMPDEHSSARILTQELSRRWNLPLTKLFLGKQTSAPQQEGPNLLFQEVAQPDIHYLKYWIAETGTDLVAVDWPSKLVPIWDICSQVDCVVVVCPALNLS